MGTDKQKQLDNERYNNYLFIKSDCIGKDIEVKRIKDLFKSYNLPITGYYFPAYVEKGLLINKDKKKGLYSFPIVDIAFKDFVEVFKYVRQKQNNAKDKTRKKSLIAVGAKEDKNLTEFKEKVNDDREKQAIKFLLSTGKYKVLKLEQVEVITYRDEWKECTIE